MKKFTVTVGIFIFLVLAGQVKAIDIERDSENSENSPGYEIFVAAFKISMELLEGRFGDFPAGYKISVKEIALETRDEKGISLQQAIRVKLERDSNVLVRLTIKGYMSLNNEEENDKIINAAGASCLKIYFEAKAIEKKRKASNEISL